MWPAAYPLACDTKYVTLLWSKKWFVVLWAWCFSSSGWAALLKPPQSCFCVLIKLVTENAQSHWCCRCHWQSGHWKSTCWASVVLKPHCHNLTIVKCLWCVLSKEYQMSWVGFQLRGKRCTKNPHMASLRMAPTIRGFLLLLFFFFNSLWNSKWFWETSSSKKTSGRLKGMLNPAGWVAWSSGSCSKNPQMPMQDCVLRTEISARLILIFSNSGVYVPMATSIFILFVLRPCAIEPLGNIFPPETHEGVGVESEKINTSLPAKKGRNFQHILFADSRKSSLLRCFYPAKSCCYLYLLTSAGVVQKDCFLPTSPNLSRLSFVACCIFSCRDMWLSFCLQLLVNTKVKVVLGKNVAK